MNGNLGRDRLWNQQIWSDIDNAVRDEVGRVRVVQRVFPCTLLANGQQVPKDQLSTEASDILKIQEGRTKPFVEIWVEFSLTQSQVDSEESLHTGRTLARLAANKIAAKEDSLLFHGNAQSAAALTKAAVAAKRPTPTHLVKDENADSLDKGLLGGDPGTTGAHPHVGTKGTTVKPEELVGKVVEGIGKLSTAHAGPYALFLSSQKFAEASTPLTGTTVTPADRIIPLVAGGFYGTGRLPDDDGLLVSLGGEPTTIYIGIDATTAFTQTEPNGTYRFRVFERIQFVARDPSVFLRLVLK
jgi:uncharacterized linocin/CFP29 family protein